MTSDLCACGCGGQVKTPSAKFLKGHSVRLAPQKYRFSNYVKAKAKKRAKQGGKTRMWKRKAAKLAQVLTTGKSPVE